VVVVIVAGTQINTVGCGRVLLLLLVSFLLLLLLLLLNGCRVQGLGRRCLRLAPS
jgi:hypothetical protein